jgi:hypothetical protein
MTSPSTTAPEFMYRPHTVSECPLAGTSFDVPPEEPSVVQLALVVSEEPVSPVNLVVLAALLAKVAGVMAFTTAEDVVIFTQPAPFKL